MRHQMLMPILAAAVLALAGSSAAIAKVTHAGNQLNRDQATAASGASSQASTKPVSEIAYHHNKVR
ncbi:MAG: hypothetical protein P4L76_03570 [Beijerinckiaceae bacterium]|nr:hypothetical protein [Beijerinckiaceae bacterium]